MKNRWWLLMAIPALIAVIAGVLVGTLAFPKTPAESSAEPSEPVSAVSEPSEESETSARPLPPTALSAGEVTVDEDMMTFLVYEQYYTYALSGGAGAPPADRLDEPYPLASDGTTWRDYFATQAASAAAYWLALAAAATDEGMTLTEEGEANADYRTALIAPAAYGVDAAAVRRVYALRGLAYRYRAALRERFTCTEEQLRQRVGLTNK